MDYEQLIKECTELFKTSNKYDAHRLSIKKYIEYCICKSNERATNDFSKTYSLYYDDDIQIQFAKTLDLNMRNNLKNWMTGSVVPQKGNIIEFVLRLIDFQITKIDYIEFCNKLLKEMGHDALHSRNIEESFAIFCMQTKKGYKFYTSNLDLLNNYIENIPKFVSFDAKELFSIKNKIMAVDVSLIKDESMKNKIEVLKIKFRKLAFHSIEKLQMLSQLDDIQKIAIEILLENDSEQAVTFYKTLSSDQKKKYKTIVKNIQSVNQIIENLYDTSLADMRNKLSSSNYDTEVETYTTRFFSSKQSELNTFLEFENYLREYGEYFTKRRNKTIKNLIDAIYIKYLKENEQKKLSLKKIAVDYEAFYAANNEVDIITMLQNRQNFKRQNLNTNDREIIGESICLFATEKKLAQMLSGEKLISRTTYVTWLIFSGLSLIDIDDYLDQSEFMTISGNENDLLSGLISFADFLSKHIESDIIYNLIELYDAFNEEENIRFPFPLYSYH